MNNFIVLIGPRSVGKSTTGKKIAKKLNCDFVDFDLYCSDKLKEEGKGGLWDFINAYVEKVGKENTHLAWKEYGLWQRKIFKEFVLKFKDKNIVLDLGGGTLSEDLEEKKVNGPLLKELGIKIFLFLPNKNEEKGIKTLFERECQRPHWKEQGWEGDKLLKKTRDDYYLRLDIFKEFADYIIYMNDKDVDFIANEVILKLN